MRKLAVGLCAALLALTGIACGDEGSSKGGTEADAAGIEALAAAADKATDAGSSRMAMTMTMTVAGQQVDADGEGIFDYDDKIGRMSMDLTIPGVGSEQTIEMIMEDRYVYSKLPAGLGGTAASEWTRMDLSSMPGGALGGANQFNQDPSQYLEFLRGASDEVEEVGTEEVRGVPTTHYEAELSFDRILDAAPDQEAAEEMRQQFEAFGDVSSIPSEVWIDEDGLPRRLTLTMSLDAEGQSLEMHMSMDLFDYGVEVDIEPPKKFQDVSAPAG